MNKGMNDHLLKIAVVVQLMLVFCIAAFFFIVGFISGATLRSWNDVKTINLDQLEYSQVDTWKQHLEIYAAATTIQIGDDVDFLINKLKRLEYQEIPEKNSERLAEGQYTFDVEKGGDIKRLFLHLQGFHYPRATKPPYIANLTLNNRRITTIRKENGVHLNNFDLAPELMSEIYDKGGAAREIVTLTEIPETLIQAFLAVEDKRFYEHWGVDVRRVFGSLLHNIRNLGRGSLQGASTITQQLSKNIYLNPHQRYIRKIKEALLAVRIETRFSKDEIMERYLNFINLGRYGSRDLLGVQEAAKSYFGKMVSELNIHECATLAGIPKSPPRYSPIRNPENCKTRRNLVIRLMREENFISDRQYQTSIAKPVDVEKSQSKQIRGSSHFLDYIHEQLKNIPLLSGQLYNNGLKVYTTIDLSMQQVAETAVADHLRELDKGYKDLPDYDENKISDSGINPIENYLQAALIAIDPKTGYIKAMVGGRDYYITRQKVNFFNRAVQAQRQPGSAFKPIVFAAMFQEPPLATPATIVFDEPWFTEGIPGTRWAPGNYKGRYYGDVTVRTILEKSINVATARLANETRTSLNGVAEGIARTVQLAENMGIKSRLLPYPALSLGASDLRLIELTNAYAVFANYGIYTEQIGIRYVEDRNGDILIENSVQRHRVLNEKIAYLLSNLLEGVIKNGTGRRARVMGIKRPVAGKTGTTNDFTDAWFMGYDSNLSVGVWVGFDDPQKSTDYEGAQAALPIWARFMKEAIRGEAKDFVVPNGIIFRKIDKETGLLQSEECPENQIILEAFLAGYEPKMICNAHN